MVLLLLLPLAVRADEETAWFFVTRARKSIEANDFDKAQEFLARSLEERADYPPALLAAADLAMARGDRPEAVRRLEACLAQRRRAGLATRELDAIKKAEEMLADADPARAELRALFDDYVRKLESLAARSERDNPEQARACWRAILRVRPDHPPGE
jgi:tetratricopeptide (TPR) repeat protein